MHLTCWQVQFPHSFITQITYYMAKMSNADSSKLWALLLSKDTGELRKIKWFDFDAGTSNAIATIFPTPLCLAPLSFSAITLSPVACLEFVVTAVS